MDRLPKGMYGCIEKTGEWYLSSINKQNADEGTFLRKKIEMLADEISEIKRQNKQLKRLVQESKDK